MDNPNGATVLARMGAILAAVMNFQTKHYGMSPSNGQIARDTGLSAGQVQHTIGLMIERGMISDNDKWPRELKILPEGKAFAVATPAEREATKKKEEASMRQSEPFKREPVHHTRPTFPRNDRVATEGVKPVKKTTRKPIKRLRYMERVNQVCRIVDALPYAPQVMDIKRMIGFKGGAASTLIGQMVEDGYVTHRKGTHDGIKLTDKGRSAILTTPAPVAEAPVAYTPEPEPAPEPAPAMASFRFKPDTFIGRATVPPMPPETPYPEHSVQETTGPDRGADLTEASDFDLIVEVNRRGYRIVR